MAFRLIGSPQVYPVTIDLAKKHRDMQEFFGERPLGEARRSYLRAEILGGRAKLFDWVLAFVASTQSWYRVNGKHSSTVVVDLAHQLPTGMQACVSKYHCDTIEDLAELWAVFDSKASARSSRDIYHAVSSTIDELSGISDPVINVCVTGINISRTFRYEPPQKKEKVDLTEVGGGDPLTKKFLSPVEKASVLRENWPFVLFVEGVAHSKTKSRKHVFRGPVIAAMFETYRKDQDACYEFWNSIATDMAYPATVERWLHNYLSTSTIQGGNGKVVLPREMYVVCLLAWNTWRKGQVRVPAYKPVTAVPVVL